MLYRRTILKKRILSLALSLVLSLGVCSPVYAAAQEPAASPDSAAVLPEANSAVGNSEASGISASDLEQEMKAKAESSDETARKVLEENEADHAALKAAAQNTGFSVTDANGNVIQEYIRDDVHYIFATNAVDLSSAAVNSSSVIAAVPDGFTIASDGLSFTGAFTSGSEMSIGMEDGTSAVFCMMQSSLPSLCLMLSGTDLSTIQQDKNIKYPGNSLTLSAAPADGGSLLKLDNSVEIKGRGNTSWTDWPKKGYQLKFDKKQAVLGMTAAKKWVLLPYSTDISLMQDKLAADLSSAIDMPVTCDCRYVDLWVNGEYLGNYLISEKAEIGNGRVELKDGNGVLCERDDIYYTDETYYYEDAVTGAVYTRKETNNDDDADLTGFNDFTSTMTAFETRLASEYSTMSYDELSQYIDVESFAKMYLLNEFCGNVESAVSSFFLYKDGAEDVIHAGPGWDFEGSMIVRADKGYGTWFMANNDCYYSNLINNPAFVLVTKQLYDKYSGAFQNMASEVDTLYAQIKDSAAMNFTRWDFFGADDTMGGFLPSSFESAVSSLKSWLEDRYSYFFVNGCASTADSVQEGHVYRFVSAVDGNYAIGIENGSKDAGANCELVPAADNASQYFTIRKMEDGRYVLYNLGSGKVLDVCEGNSDPGTNIWQYDDNGSFAQRWVIDDAGDGSVVIRDALGTILDLSGGSASDGQNIWAYTANRSDAQRFYPQEIVLHADDEAVDGGIYAIEPACAPGKCLDAADGSVSNGTNIRQYDANGTDAQKFRFTKKGDSWVITCYKGGKALDVANASAENGANVWEYRKNGSTAQNWSLIRNSDGSYSFISELGKALDIAGASSENFANAQVYEANGSAAQEFYLAKQDVPEVYDGTYRIASLQDSGLCISSHADSMEQQANIELGESSEEDSKYFTVYHTADFYYSIVNEASGLMLDVQSGGTDPGTNIWQYPFNGGAAQLWRIEKNPDGSYSFISACNQLAMDIQYGADVKGTNIWCYTGNGSDAQKWLLEEPYSGV